MNRFKQVLKTQFYLYWNYITVLLMLGLLLIGGVLLISSTDQIFFLSIGPAVIFGSTIGIFIGSTTQNFPMLIESGVTRKHFFWSQEITMVVASLGTAAVLTGFVYAMDRKDFLQGSFPSLPLLFLLVFLLFLCVQGASILIPFLARSWRAAIGVVVAAIFLVSLFGILIPHSVGPFLQEKIDIFDAFQQGIIPTYLLVYLIGIKLILQGLFYLVIRKIPARR